MLRLDPMDDTAFAAFVQRAVPRRAERWVRRGIWLPDQALETSRREYAALFAKGRQTPNHHFFDVVETSSGTTVGEAWYEAVEAGGKLQFWIQWIAIWPEFQRRGYGRELLGVLEAEARRLGAERTILSVWMDNPGALALYTKVGYATTSLCMTKAVEKSA
jgi:ribosomal protein S18 acetylase RimI-like enzyme